MKSLGKKLTLGFVLIISISMVVVSVCSVVQASNNLFRQIVQKTNYSLIAQSNLVDGKMDLYKAVLTTFNADLALLPKERLQDKAFVKNMLESLIEKHPEFIDMYFAFPDGSAIFASGWIPPADYDATARAWYQEAVSAQGKVSFAKPYVEMERGDLVVAAVGSHVENGAVSFVTAIEITMDGIFEVVDALEIEDAGYGFLINKSADVYHYPHESYNADGETFRKIDERLAALTQAQNGDPGFMPVLTKGPDGRTYYFFGQGLNAMDWTFGAAVPQSVITKQIVSMAVVGAGLTIAAIVISILISSAAIRRMVSKPVQDLAAIADSIALGNIENEIHITRDDEIGGLQRSFQSMQATISGQVACLTKIADGDLTVEVHARSEKDAMGIALRELLLRNSDMLRKVQQAAVQVSTGAEQISDGASALAAGSTEQAATVEQFSQTVASLQKQAGESANMAAATEREIEKVGDRMDTGLASMEQMTQAMQIIDKSSREIAKVMKVIDDIAFQTNILALNAAVEAARAGQHGKGFAVVADEVRNLANKSAEAAKETAVLIGHSVQNVKSGSEILLKMADNLKDVGEIADANTQQMRQLTELAQWQNRLIIELNAGIEQISKVVQTNAATAEENAAASQEMSMQSAQLNEIVGRFQLRDTGEDFVFSAYKEDVLLEAPYKEDIY